MEGQMEGKKVGVLASHFVCEQPFSLVNGRLRSWVVVLIRAWGSSSSALSFVVAVAVLGAGVSFVGAASSFVGDGARPRAVYVVRGWGPDVRRLWLSYTRGVEAAVGP